MNCFIPYQKKPNKYKTFLEAQIIKHLQNKYKDQDVVIRNDPYCYLEVSGLDVDLEFMRVAFGNFRAVTINQFGVHIGYE